MGRKQLEAHAAVCREAMAAGRERPRWEGGAYLSGANLSDADLRGADLEDVRLASARLAGANLAGANLTKATLVGADLRGANLSDADLSDADLAVARLRNANLSGANLAGARLSEGVACGRAISGKAGGCRWWAVSLDGGGAVLEYDGEAGSLNWWIARGRQFYSPEHWEEGPAVAIAATVAMVEGVTDPPFPRTPPDLRALEIDMAATETTAPETTVFYSIGEAAMALGADGLERAQLLGRSVASSEEDDTGRGWLDLQSDAQMLGVKIEVEPHPGGRVWIVRN